MASDCPDNSTECLLRALIATTATQTSPWEPRSFGFTVAIGVAAFLISFVAIFQGLLAAGPGRIKASSDAIGAFSKYSKGSISWREFAWRSTASIPTITFEDLLREIPKQHQNVEYGTAFFNSLNGISTGATWLALLKCVGLDEDIEALFEDTLQPWPTDHLPADVQAPPAAIQLRCLAVLSAIADPSTTIEKGSRFPVIGGAVSQVSFREHSVLGTLAAYERYHTQKPRTGFIGSLVPPPYASIGRCTRFALELAEGSIFLQWPTMRGWNLSGPIYFSRRPCPILIFDPDNAPQISKKPHLDEAGIAAALCHCQTDYEIRPFPWQNACLETSVMFLLGCMPRKYQDFKADVISACLGSCGFTTSKTGSSLESAIAFKARGSWVVPFEGERLWRTMYVDDLAGGMASALISFGGSLKGNNGLGSLSARKDSLLTHDVTNYSWENTPDVCFVLEHVDAFLGRNRTQAIHALNRVTNRLQMVQAMPAFNATGADSATIPTSSTPDPNPTNGQTVGSPAQSPASGAASGHTSSSTGSQHRNSHSSLGSAATQQTSAIDIAATGSVEEAFEALIVLRGLIFAACLAAGPDTSLLWSADFKNSFVRVM